MKFFLALLIASIGHQNALAQDCEELAEKAVFHYQNGNLERAIEYAERALPVCERELGKAHKNYIFLRNFGAFVHEQAGDHDRALQLYSTLQSIRSRITHYYDSQDYQKALLYANRAVEICDSLKPLSDPGCIDISMMMGILNQEMGLNKKAEEHYDQTIRNAKLYWDTLKTPFASLMADVAFQYELMSRFGEALTFYKKAVLIYENHQIIDLKNYCTLLRSMASIQTKTGQFDAAISNTEKVLVALNNSGTKINEEYIFTLLDLGLLYRKSDNDSSALTIYKKAKKLSEIHLEKNHLAVRIAIANWAKILIDQEDFYSAKPVLAQLYKRFKKMGETTDKNGLAMCILDMALVEEKLGNYEIEVRLRRTYMKTVSGIMGKASPNYIEQLRRLAALEMKYGKMDSALIFYERGLELVNRMNPIDSFYYSRFLSALAVLYVEFGNYEIALEYHLEALPIIKAVNGANSMDHRIAVSNLASLLAEIGQFQKAEGMINSLLEYKKITSNIDLEYAKLLNNKASIYIQCGKYIEALELFQEAVSFYEENDLAEDSRCLAAWRSIAGLYEIMDQNALAIHIFRDLAFLCPLNSNEDSLEYAMTLNGLGSLYTKTGIYTSAIDCYDQAIEIMGRILPESHPDYAMTIRSKATHFAAFGDYDRAIELIQEYENRAFTTLKRVYPILSEDGKRAYYKYKKGAFELENSWLINADSAKQIRRVYEFHAVNKGLVLAQTSVLTKAMTESIPEEHKTKHEQWLSLLRIINFEYSKPEHLRKNGLDSLELKAEQLEEQLSLVLKNHHIVKNSLQLSADMLRQVLGKNNALIDFSAFRYWNKTWTDTIQYVAYIVLPGDTNVKMVHLGTQYDFATKKASPLYDSRSLKEVRRPDPEGAKLLNAVYSLKPYLEGIDTLYLSPSGIFNQVNVATLTLPDSSRLWDHCHVAIKSSVRELLNEDAIPLREKNLVLFGGLRYADDHPAANDSLDCFNPTQEVMKKLSERGPGNGIWEKLPWSATEVLDIESISLSSGHTTTVLKNDEGSETAFKALDGNSPYVLHLATHGYFFENPTFQKQNSLYPTSTYGTPFRLTDDPMMRSGLALSGANRAWRHGCNPYAPEDGILTAREISHMDLSQTELVVLSACQTGLGDIDNSEGVYGLQRAFKMAGVNYIIMSLWNVPDHQTSELMVAFYCNWLEKEMRLSEAFYSAQKKMAADYPDKPELWAGFVLVQ